MKKQFALIFTILFVVITACAQPKPTIKPVVKQPKHELEKILTGIGLPYKIVGDSLAVIPYEGEHIKSFQVVIQQISDLYIVLSNLTEAMPDKIGEANYKYLLQQNINFDFVKIGINSDDNTIALRADLYKAGTNTALLKRIITQVANITNIIAGELK